MTTEYNRQQLGTLSKKLSEDRMVFVFGPRQAGKTTISKTLSQNYENAKYFSGDILSDRELLDPDNFNQIKSTIAGSDIITIDEAQKIPQIGDTLKQLYDYTNTNIIVTGSSSFDLMQSRGDTLAGRGYDTTFLPMTVSEIVNNFDQKWYSENLDFILNYGTYPNVIKMHELKQDTVSIQDHIANIAENSFYKDILTLDKIKKPKVLQKLLQILANRVGSEISIAGIANDIDTSSDLIERYVDILEKMYLIFTLPSYSTNQDNEIKKGKKIYFWDNGIRNYLANQFNDNLDYGKAFENFVVSEIAKQRAYKQLPGRLYFWRSKTKSEVDIVYKNKEKLTAIEIKYNPKQAKKTKLPVSFKNNYPNAEFMTIDRVTLPNAFEDLIAGES